MKHYKSKRGYFYKMVGDKKTRISIEEYKSMKGGKLKENGILDKENFSQIIEIPLRRVKNNNESLIELQEMKRENVKNNNIDIKSIPEPKIMRQKGFRKEPYIFFGFNPNTNKYRYVFYNDLRWRWFSKIEIIPSNNITNEKKVICKKLEDNDTIVELKHIDITKIPLKILSHLFIFLLKKRKENEDFMERLFYYLYNVIYHKITKIKNNQSTYYTERIINHNIDFKFLKNYYNIDKFKEQFINTSV